MTREEAIKWLKNCALTECEDCKYINEPDDWCDIQVMRIARMLETLPNCQKCAIKELWQETEKEDLVSVVRCKDCRHGWYDDDIEYYTCRHPKGLNDELYGVDYCSCGQTKEQTEYKLPGYDEIMDRLDNLKLEFTIHGTERVKRMVGDDHE